MEGKRIVCENNKRSKLRRLHGSDKKIGEKEDNENRRA